MNRIPDHGELPRIPAVNAIYRRPDDPNFNSNELIDVLPPIETCDEKALARIRWMPKVGSAERLLPNSLRLVRLMQLQNVCIPMNRQLEIIHTLNAFLHASYQNRSLNGPEQARTAQELYALRHSGVNFASIPPEGTGLSTGLFGLPGLGKTSVVKRWAQGIEKVIFHPRYHAFQVPVLIAEAPATSNSFRGFLYSILHQLDARIPKANYFQTFGVHGRPNDNVLLRNVIDRCNEHYLGVLFVDETQNLANYGKGGESLLAELVGATNQIKSAVVFMGTNRAVDLVARGFHGGRRLVSTALPLWDRFPETVEDGEDEFAEVMLALWSMAIIRKLPELDEKLLATFYSFTQGILAIMVALFAACQREAIESGSETITIESVTRVFETRFKPVHAVIDALREDDVEALNVYQDAAPPLSQTLWKNCVRDVSESEAEQSVDSFERASTTKKRRGRIPTRVPRAKRAPADSRPDAEPYAEMDLQRDDFRFAVREAYREKTTIYEQLCALGLAPRDQELLAMF